MKGRDASEQDNVLQYINQTRANALKGLTKIIVGVQVRVNSFAYRKIFRAQN